MWSKGTKLILDPNDTVPITSKEARTGCDKKLMSMEPVSLVNLQNKFG